VTPKLMTMPEVRRAVQNKAKRDAVRILHDARSKCSPGSTAERFLSRCIDHVVTPERWS
jgi:hypothetical protein